MSSSRVSSVVAFVLTGCLTVVVGCSSSAADTPEQQEEEAGVDSGPPPGPPCSRLTTKCKEGGTCEGAADCDTALCRDGTCRVIEPANGTKNGDETDIDCGGTMAPACADNKGCMVGGDCTSGVCKTNICQPPSFTDGVKNGDETGLDCGGPKPNAPKCPTGQGCLADTDCDKVKCDLVNKKCLGATHTDGIKNLDETGIDCGGPTATVKRCATGEGCVDTADCDNVLCNTGTKLCDPPKPDDGLKNGTESDIDCGGGAPTDAVRCHIASKCTVNGDCDPSAACSATLGTCTTPSCATAEVAGINSCGALETAAGVVHESCCKSLVLPTKTDRRLDKYEITSGRFRTFLTKVGPNVRKWVTDYIATHAASQLAALAAAGPDVTGTGADVTTLYPNADRFVPHSLTAHMSTDIDNYNGIRGCYNGLGNTSANTYWQDNTHLADFGLPTRTYSRAVSDEKPLNCAMPMMFAAFCAWDGGELATIADYRDAWTATYPWGAADIFRPKYNWCNGPYPQGGFTCQCDNVHNIGAQGCPAGGFTNKIYDGVFYSFPNATNAQLNNDREPFIAAPGRMIDDATALKSYDADPLKNDESWFDLFANLAEYTGDITASAEIFCDYSVGPTAGVGQCSPRYQHGTDTADKYVNIPRMGIIGQTWEGHQYNRGSTNVFPVTFQYGKFGGRCVRPADPY